MLDCDHLGALRREWLFPIAHLAHVPPEQQDRLTIGDWAVLIEECERYLKAQQAQVEG